MVIHGVDCTGRCQQGQPCCLDPKHRHAWHICQDANCLCHTPWRQPHISRFQEKRHDTLRSQPAPGVAHRPRPVHLPKGSRS